MDKLTVVMTHSQSSSIKKEIKEKEGFILYIENKKSTCLVLPYDTLTILVPGDGDSSLELDIKTDRKPSGPQVLHKIIPIGR